MPQLHLLLWLCMWSARVRAEEDERDLAFKLLSDMGARDNDTELIVEVEDGRVVRIWAPLKQLKGSIPVELGNLTALRVLNLRENQLTGEIPTQIGSLVHLRNLFLSDNNLAGHIPSEMGHMASLTLLDLSHNKLTGRIPPEVGNMTDLVTLHLSGNRLTGPIPMTISRLISLQYLRLSDNNLTGPIPPVIGRLTALQELLLTHNQLAGPIPSEIGDVVSLRHLRLSGNKLAGWIPPEVGKMTNLLTLGLARNKLSGPIPRTIGRLTALAYLNLDENQLAGQFPREIAEQLPKLEIVTLHQNFLEGQFPSHWGSAARLMVLTLHENRFRGSLPRLQNMTRLRFLTLHGNHFSGTVPRLDLPKTAKATLHSNRFSCQLPASLGLEGVRATVVMGNMVGIGDNIAADWVSPTEVQDFLYVSSTIWWGNVLVLAGLPVAFLVVGVIYRQSRQATAGSTEVLAPDIHASWMQSLRLSLWIAGLCAPLLPAYLHGARYYECGQPLAWSTAAYLDESPLTELFVVLVWSFTTLFFSASVAVLPKPREALRGSPNRSWHVRRQLAWLLWIVPVTMVSLPSILYVVAQALPKDNTLVPDSVLEMAHHTAPALVVAFDMLLAAPLSIRYGGVSGIPADRLLMALRSCAAWLLPLLAALTLQENCLAGWKTWWTACDPKSRMNAEFNWALSSGVVVLNTTTDMCRADRRNLWEGSCSRSVIQALSPLILRKLLIRITLQPLVVVVAWQASKLEDQRTLDEGGRQLRLLGRKASGSLASMQQHAYFTTLLETAIIWGPLVPLVSLGVVAAFLSSTMLLEIGLSFGVQLPTDATNKGAGLSRSFLRLALATSCSLQFWHAFSTSMAGRTILLLSAMLAAAVSAWGLPHALQPPRREADEQEMTEMEGASAEFPPQRISSQSVS
ncbi:MIK2 [Symbiodinium sp. CCMP2592]|nr:MIK2 [Symbiodinium sp. CCMP2592]